MAETHTGHPESEHHHGIRRKGSFILSGLSSGHGIFHWVNHSFMVMLPEVRDTFELSSVQVGAISSTREIAGGVIALPGGVLTDMLRRYWGAVLAACMAVFGIGWLVMGLAPLYPVLLVGMAMVAISSSIWHLPGVAALSHHFAHRRGAALSFHGIGGSAGDVLGPVLTGFLLGVLTWRGIIAIYAAVPLFLTFLVFWAFRDIGKFGDGASETQGVRAQMTQSWSLLRNQRLWGITLVAGLRGMAFVALITFLPLYLEDVAELSKGLRGVYFALPMVVGILFTPIMGYLSDRLGRKLVLVPGMIFLSTLALLLALFGEGITLPVIIGLMGLFLYSDQPILMAAALDIVRAGVAGTTLGVLSFSRFGLSAASPLIGGILYDADKTYPFFYVAGLFALATVILLAVPLGTGNQTADSPPVDHHGHGAPP
jgi:FSR family fosmidomycin resistance protein-like MFS transporter